MAVKKYNESAFTELMNTLNKHIDGGNSLPVFTKMINEVNEQFPGLKDTFIHDMGEFLTHWFELVNDCKLCSAKLQAKILTIDMIMKYSDFNRFVPFCYDVIDQTINPHTNRLYAQDLTSYLACIVKAVIQTTRRAKGLDLNSKKYGNATKDDTTATGTAEA